MFLAKPTTTPTTTTTTTPTTTTTTPTTTTPTTTPTTTTPAPQRYESVYTVSIPVQVQGLNDESSKEVYRKGLIKTVSIVLIELEKRFSKVV